MARLLTSIIFLSWSLSAWGVQKNEKTFLDGVVAEVDASPILHSQIDEKVKKGPLIKVSPYPAPESASSYEQALQDEINMRIIVRKAGELGIEIEDAKIEEHIEKIQQQNKLSRAGLIDFLSQQGKTFKSYRKDTENQLLLMHFRGRVLMPLVKVTQRDIENYYAKKTGTSSEAISFYLRQIFLAAPANSPQYKKQQQKAEEIYQQLSKGKNFRELEKSFDRGDGNQAAETFVVKAKDLAPQIRAEVEALGEGQFSKPIATGAGVYVIFVERKDFADKGGFAAQKEQLEYELRQNELATQLNRWLEQERSKSKITIVHPK
jgi:peptidyl-prolyl cis-trans isomerase SurA